MASLALGIAGAVIGGIIAPGIGASIGFMIGSALGSALDPQKIQGPKLTDLHVQGTEYGTSIPILYGSMRIASCCVLWKSDLIPHDHTSGGKKQEVTNTTYSCSFALLLCEGEIDSIPRVWADNRLVRENGEGLEFVTYLGTETQLPDPTGEALLGAGNVPAHRGYAYVSFTDLDLTDYGNRIPNFTFEIVQKGELPLGPIRRIEQNYDDGYQFMSGALADYQFPAITHWPMTGGSIRVQQVETEAVHSYHHPMAGAYLEFDRSSLTLTDASATPVDPEFPHHLVIENVEHNPGCLPYYVWNMFPIGIYVDADDNNIDLWIDPRNSVGTTSIGPAVFSVSVAPYDCSSRLSSGNLLYTAGVPASLYVNAASLTQDGKSLFVFTGPLGTTGGPDTITDWYEIRDGTVVRQGTVIPNLDIYILGFGNSAIFHNECSMFENNRKFCWVYRGAAGIYTHFPTGDGGSGIAVTLYQIDSSLNFALIPFPEAFPHLGTGGGTANLGDPVPPPAETGNEWGSIAVIKDGYAGVVSGNNMAVFTRFPVGDTGDTTLADIVADLSARAGLDPGQIDVSELTDIVHGYVIANQSDARSALAPLQTAYFFDAVESGALIKFRKRGGDPLLTIPDDELAAREENAEPPALLTFTRAQEVDLPRRITTTYLDFNAAYQNGSQNAQRMVTSSLAEMSVQLPIALDSDEAKRIADRLLWSAWYERDSFTFTTPRKYAYLEPTDCVIAGGRSLRISTREEQPGGVIKWTGVQSIGAVFMSDAGGPGGGGGGVDGGGNLPPDIVLPQDTDLELLDIAYIADPARQNVYWAAMAGAERESWRGAALYRSKDAVNYDDIAESHAADIIGSADTALGSFLGGNVFDEVNNVDITIGPGGGELSSTTRDAILDGANQYMLGSEILQARDATLIAESSYRLAGLLRGRHGTEWAMDAHIEGERFVVLPTNNELAYQTSDIGVSRQYKAVTFGNTIASAIARTKVLRGISMTPYSPVFPSAGINASGDWTLQWLRRARVNGTWLNYADVPLDEPSERYLVTLWTDALYTTVATTLDCTTTTTTVTAAQQTAIFGSPQSELFWTVAQIGRLGPGYDTLGRAPTVATPPPTVPVPPTIPSDAIYLGELHFDGSQITSEGVTGTKVAYGLIAIPNPLPASWWSGQQTYVSIFESASGTYAKRMWLSRSPFDYTPVYPAYSEGNGAANIYMVFNAASSYAVTVAPGEVWYLTIKNELPDGTPSCPPGGNGNFSLRMYPPNI